jgi:hypothetical protein
LVKRVGGYWIPMLVSKLTAKPNPNEEITKP